MSDKSAFLLARRWGRAIFAVSFLLAIFAGYHHLNYERSERQAQINQQSTFVFNAIRQQLDASTQISRSLQSSMLLSHDITQESFQDIYNSLNPKSFFPSLQAIAYSPLIIDDYGQEHYFVSLVAPLENNEALLGLDVTTQPANYRAVLLSNFTGKPTLSEPFILNQDIFDRDKRQNNKPRGITVRMPVYEGISDNNNNSNRNLVGSLGVSFRIEDIIKSALPEDKSLDLYISITDVTNGKSLSIYDDDSRPLNIERNSSRTFEFGQRVWKVDIYPKKEQLSVFFWPLITVIFVSLTGLLLSFIVYASLKSRVQAITLAKEMKAKYYQAEDKYSHLNEMLPGPVMLADTKGDVLYMNKSSRQKFGFEDNVNILNMLGLPSLLINLEKNQDKNGNSLLQISKIQLKDFNNNNFWASLSVSKTKLNGVYHILVLVHDISDMVEATQQLEIQGQRLHFMATHDQLTGLSNRLAFEDALESTLLIARKERRSFAVILMDLDQFKIINDTAGHMAGDKLLSSIAEGLREIISPQHILARLGGDEFGLIMLDATKEDAIDCARSIKEFFDEFFFPWESNSYQVSTSIGIDIFDDKIIAKDGRKLNKEDLLSRADAACYIAKEQGRNRWHIFSDNDISLVSQQEMGWVVKIRQSIAENKIILYKQEIKSLSSNEDGDKNKHYEILIRMKLEDGQIISAGQFIPAAERYGLMPLLDRWIVENVFSNFVKFNDDNTVFAINLSGQTLDDPEFETFFLDLIDKYKIPPNKICLEITETTAIKNINKIQKLVFKFRKLGFKFALDDFGAGMSSFGYLKNFQVDYVKIDGSFIRDIESNKMSASIVSAVTNLAHKMGMQVIAEWVGSSTMIDILKKEGVDFIQGYFVHEPSPLIIDKTHKPSQ